MSNIISISMGGYLNEKGKMMTRKELNKRIDNIQQENHDLKKHVKSLQKDSKILCDALELADGKLNPGQSVVALILIQKALSKMAGETK